AAVNGDADGTALGVGSLSGKIFANTNEGQVIEIDLNDPTDQVLIASGGSRGDFATVDPNTGTLLLTQSGEVVRLIPGAGGGFGGGPNLVQGNLIGTTIAGTAPLPNQVNGVLIQSAGNTVGGSAAGTRNIISGNNLRSQTTGYRSVGVVVTGVAATDNLIQGNFIGTD